MTIEAMPKFLVRVLVETNPVAFDFLELDDARAKAAELLEIYPGEQVEIYQLMEIDYTDISEVKIASLIVEP